MSMAGSFFADAADPGDLPVDLYEETRWYACYTRARAEKQVVKTLNQRGFESYLPLIPRQRQWKDRKKVVPFPLFPSYVFGRFTLRDVHSILTTPGVSTIVRTRGQPTPIPDEELENVRRFAEAIAATGIEPEARPLIQEGQRVRVTEGAFEGVEGIVIESRGRKRVLVGITAIGQGLEIDIDTRLLKPLRG
jgi:transcription termination/antitermination protein NusG